MTIYEVNAKKLYKNKVLDVLEYILAWIVAKLIRINPKYRDIWIITERHAECKDNGYHFFKYMRENFPEKKAYYAILKGAEQASKIQAYGNVIWFNSFKHQVLAIAAEKLIGAFDPCGIPETRCFNVGKLRLRGKRIFLQHGITKEYMKNLLYSNCRFDMFVCGGLPEYKYVKDSFGYPDGVVVHTGFCRYDALMDYEVQKFILIMPTWRAWIPGSTWDTDKKLHNPENEKYFRAYKELLSNKQLDELLNKYGYKVIFYPHHEMQIYMDYFENFNTDNIIIASEDEYDVQDLLKKASCLITDYSSIAFDFGYMKKPIIYYQFDEEEYFDGHYARGYFDFRTMGFGKVAEDFGDVINELSRVLQKDCVMEQEYERRVDAFFLYRDQDNCKRVYEKIIEMFG